MKSSLIRIAAWRPNIWFESVWHQSPEPGRLAPIIDRMSSVNHYHSTALYRAAQVRGLDRLARKSLGVAGNALMRRGGSAAFELIRVRWSVAASLRCFCVSCFHGGCV